MPAASARRRQSLAGASLIITRPAATAAALARAARALGADVVRLPGVRLRVTENAAEVRAALLRAQNAELWIFTSPSAVRFSLQLAGSLPLSAQAGVLAVGAGTARALARHGIQARAPTGQQNSEGLLAEAALSAPLGKSIVIVDAPGGRDILAPALRERGATVERIGVYERLPPRLTQRHFDALGRAERPWLTVLSSGEALSNLIAVLPASLAETWRHESLIVSSLRLATQARELGFVDVHEARSALTADLLEAACAALGRHRL